MGDPNIITLDEGWNKQIKVVALDPLEVDFTITWLSDRGLANLTMHLTCLVQTMLEEGFKTKTRLFSNQEYAKVYT